MRSLCKESPSVLLNGNKMSLGRHPTNNNADGACLWHHAIVMDELVRLSGRSGSMISIAILAEESLSKCRAIVDICTYARVRRTAG